MKGSVYRRGTSWSYMFEIEPDPLTGKRRQRTKAGFATEEAAWDAMREAIVEYRKGRDVKPSKRTVKEFLTEWLQRTEHKVKPTTWANDNDYIRAYVIPHIGARKLQDIDETVVDALYLHLLKAGRIKAGREHRRALEEKAAARAQKIADRKAGRKTGPGPTPKDRPRKPAPPPGLAPKTVVNVHRTLHRAFSDAVAWRYLAHNPVSNVAPPRVPRTARRTWTIDQLQRFLTLACEDRFYALWVLEATTGMRRCELAGARRDDLNLEDGLLLIADTRVVVHGRVHDSDGKTHNAQRPIALDPFTCAALGDHLDTLAKERALWAADYHDHGLLFCWPDGRPPHPDTFTSRFNRLAEKAGLPKIRLHDVRHTYATAARRAKIDWKALSERIGHSSVSFTMQTYVHGDPDVDRAAANAVAALILKGVPHRRNLEDGTVPEPP